jgi:hypothetical protein
VDVATEDPCKVIGAEVAANILGRIGFLGFLAAPEVGIPATFVGVFLGEKFGIAICKAATNLLTSKLCKTCTSTISSISSLTSLTSTSSSPGPTLNPGINFLLPSDLNCQQVAKLGNTECCCNECVYEGIWGQPCGGDITGNLCSSNQILGPEFDNMGYFGDSKPIDNTSKGYCYLEECYF